MSVGLIDIAVKSIAYGILKRIKAECTSSADSQCVATSVWLNNRGKRKIAVNVGESRQTDCSPDGLSSSQGDQYTTHSCFARLAPIAIAIVENEPGNCTNFVAIRNGIRGGHGDDGLRVINRDRTGIVGGDVAFDVGDGVVRAGGVGIDDIRRIRTGGRHRDVVAVEVDVECVLVVAVVIDFDFNPAVARAEIGIDVRQRIARDEHIPHGRVSSHVAERAKVNAFLFDVVEGVSVNQHIVKTADEGRIGIEEHAVVVVVQIVIRDRHVSCRVCAVDVETDGIVEGTRS